MGGRKVAHIFGSEVGAQWLEKRSNADSAHALAEVIGVDIDRDKLALAMTHRSFAYENGQIAHNERLEFLGDAVLGLVIAQNLYQRFPSQAESQLSPMRASLVNMNVLAQIASELCEGGLGRFLHLGKGEEQSGGRTKPSINADAFESVIGAMYLDKGLQTCTDWITGVFTDRLDNVGNRGASLDWKTSLQEKAAAKNLSSPKYAVTSTGPDHQRVFTATVDVGGNILGEGTGTTRKEAEQNAAEQAWNHLSAKKKKSSPEK